MNIQTGHSKAATLAVVIDQIMLSASFTPNKAMECAADLLSVKKACHWSIGSPYLPMHWHCAAMTPRDFLDYLNKNKEVQI